MSESRKARIKALEDRVDLLGGTRSGRLAAEELEKELEREADEARRVGGGDDEEKGFVR